MIISRTQQSLYRDLTKDKVQNPDAYIKVIDNKIDALPYEDFETFLFVLEQIFAIEACCESLQEFNEKMDMALGLWDLIFRERYSERIDCLSIYLNALQVLGDNPQYFKTNTLYRHIYNCRDIVTGIYDTCRSKNLFLQLLSALCSLDNIEAAYYAVQYFNMVRQYYIDERAAASACIDLLSRIKTENNANKINEIVQEKIMEDKKNAGIYDVSRDELEEMDFIFSRIKADIDTQRQASEEIRQFAENHRQSLENTIDGHCKQLSKAAENALNEIRAEKSAILSDLSASLEEFRREVSSIIDDAPAGAEDYIVSAAKPFAMKNEDISHAHPHNPLFENELSFEEKWALYRSNKKGDALYHDRFDAVAKILLYQKPARSVLLVGPSGAGKTHTVEQLSEALELKLYSMGYVNEEYKLIGFKDANSNFDITPFYIAFKYGGLCFFDELDNSHPGALMLLHEFMGTSNGASFIFPNKEEVHAHPYFRLIAAANTWGDGANRTYNVRAKLDGATENRFKAIKYDYDPKVEDQLTADGELLAFMRAYRAALEKNDYPQPLTYRDIMDMDAFVNDGIFTIEEALEINLIKGAGIDKLNKIRAAIKDLEAVSNNKYYHALSKIIGNMR